MRAKRGRGPSAMRSASESLTYSRLDWMAAPQPQSNQDAAVDRPRFSPWRAGEIQSWRRSARRSRRLCRGRCRRSNHRSFPSGHGGAYVHCASMFPDRHDCIVDDGGKASARLANLDDDAGTQLGRLRGSTGTGPTLPRAQGRPAPGGEADRFEVLVDPHLSASDRRGSP
jgi:hypothetical protein